MITQQELQDARERAKAYFDKAGIVLTEEEFENIEVLDFGLSNLEVVGLQLVVYVNTERVCAKELVLFPRQTCPEHRHPPVGEEPGKEETFRCRWGQAYLCVPGQPTSDPKAIPLKGREQYFTVWREIVLKPGDQYTLPPDTLHWLQAGDEGAVLSEFSTRSRDELNIFTDPDIELETVVR